MNNFVKSLINIHGKRLTLIEIAAVFLFPLMYRQFYRFYAVPDVVMRLSVYASVLGSLVYAAEYLFLRKYPKGSIPQYVRLIFVAILISSIVAFVSREQSLILSYRTLTPLFLGYIYFFVLYKIKPHPSVIIKLIFAYAALYAVCFLWAMISAPNVIFGSAEKEFDESRGTFRVGVGGLQFMCLFFFYSVTQIVKNYKWAILSAISYIFIIFALTRQIIASTLLVAGMYLVWKKKWLRYVVAILTLFVLTLQNIDLKFDDNSVIGSLINTTTTQVEEHGTEDIRILAFKAFINDFHQNILEVCFGSGATHVDCSYGQWEQKNFVSKGYIRSDIGYIGTYVTFGIFGLMIFILTFYKAVIIKNVGVFVFAQLFIYYCLLTNIASWPFRSNCIEISICLYLLTLCSMRRNRAGLNNIQIIHNEILNNHPSIQN